MAEPSTARLSVGLLGAFEVRRDGVPVGLGSRRTEALFAYLVHTGKVHARDHLVDVLWNDESSAKAAGNLRVLLTNLRRHVGDFVEITRTTVAFKPTGPAKANIDVHAFNAHSTVPLRMKVAELRRPERDELEASLRVFQGDFMERFDLPGSIRFHHWLTQERQSLHEQRLTVLRHLIEAELTAAATPQALQHARLLLELQPLDETSHQLLIRTHVQAGDLDGAVRQFDLLEAMQRTEFGATPSATTRALFAVPRAVRAVSEGSSRDRLPSTGSTAPTARTPRQPWSRFVGRSSELTAILTGFEQARSGSGSVLFVNGEAGSGKTTLVRKAVRLLIERDANLVALCGSCADPAGSADEAVLAANMLAQLSGDTSGPWLEQRFPVAVATRLGSLFGVGETPALQDLSSTARVIQSIRRLAEIRPVLVVLDDLHWAAPATVNLVAELARDIRHRRILIIATVRPEAVEPAGGRPGTTGWLVARTRRLAGGRIVDLDHDDPARGREFVDAVLAGETLLPQAFRGELLFRTEGHPLIAVETLRDLVRRGQLVQNSAGRFTLGDAQGWPDGFPRRVSLMVEERLTGVPEELRTVLEAAAVQGSEFDAHVVAKVCERTVGSVITDLSRRLGRDLRLVAELDPSPGAHPSVARYRFRHQAVRAHLLSCLGRGEHAQLLGAVAAAKSDTQRSPRHRPHDFGN